MAKEKKILYFIVGALATAADKKAIEGLKGQVCQRNAQHVPADGALEACDAVSGVAPERYYEAYPHVGKCVLYTTDFDPADIEAQAQDDLTQEEADEQQTAGDAVNDPNGQTGLPLGVETEMTPAMTSPKKQTQAVEAGKSVALTDAANAGASTGSWGKPAAQQKGVKATDNKTAQVQAAASASTAAQ